MRKLFWLAVFVGGYIWMVTTGNEELVLARGKILYRWIYEWMKDADVDFQVKKNKKISQHKKSKRWD